MLTRRAEPQVVNEIFLLNNIAARNGTNFTFKYSRNALFDAVVVSSPMAWDAKPRNVHTPSSIPLRIVRELGDL